jgi:hypothetical protein
LILILNGQAPLSRKMNAESRVINLKAKLHLSAKLNQHKQMDEMMKGRGGGR